MAGAKRLDGWKAIGGHFGRDRTTVMRWARSRGLPVRRLPGGKTATVYAMADELDQWAANQTGLNDDVSESDSPRPDALPSPDGAQTAFQPYWQRNWRRFSMLGLMLLAIAFAIGNVWPREPRPRAAPELPSDPRLSALYLEARDDWAQRKPETIGRALNSFETITKGEPGFAPAWSGLAEAYLLSREFGNSPDAEAFPKALTAAETALHLNPDLASAHRALGFIHYWWLGEPKQAGKDFRRALDLSPRDAQTHFWYGNILADNGQSLAALRELNTARLIEPGSVAIQTDLAWAQWSAGDEASARSTLTQLIQTHPNFPVVHDCWSLIKLADGDYIGYVQHLSEYARLIDDKALLKHVVDLRAALNVDVVAVQNILMSKAMTDIRNGRRKTHLWPVFLASIAQDRKQVIAYLQAADARKEIWGEAGLTGRVVRLWMDDAEIYELINRRRGENVE